MDVQAELPAVHEEPPAEVRPADPPPPAPATTPSPPASPPATAAAVLPVEEKASLDLLTFHKDNYFLTGFTADTQVKFQFSAKYDIWPNTGHHAAHFAITQKSLWDIFSTSSPFRENNYNPELFYTYFHNADRYVAPIGCAFFYQRAGVDHESNGESVPRSRGWNRVYGESRFACYGEGHNYGMVTLRAWAPPFGTNDNPDIVRYLGYGELALSAGTEGSGRWYGEADVTVRGRKGTSRKLGVGSIQIDARWRPRLFAVSRFTPYLFAQFFTGYGETMLTYNDPLTNIRVGIGFSDRSTRSQ